MVRVGILISALSFVTPISGPAQVDPLVHDSIPILSRDEIGRIGGLDDRPEYALTTVESAVVLPNGEIALADRGAHEIRFYDRSGVFLRKMGREGDGPGEFRAIVEIVPLGDDRILAWDIERQRMTVFTVEGQLVNTGPLSARGTESLFRSFIGVFPDGRIVMRAVGGMMGMRNERPGRQGRPVVYGIFAPTGELLDTTISVEGPERQFFRDGNSSGLERLLLARELAAAVIPDGLVVGLTDSFHLRILDGVGEWKSYLRVDRPTRSATMDFVEAERARYMEAAEARAETPPDPRLPIPDARRQLAQVEIRRLKDRGHHPTIPAFGGLLTASDGALWVSDYPDFLGGVTTWYVWDQDKQMVGRITLPVEERVVAAGFGLLLTVTQDEFDLESLVVSRLLLE